MRDRVLRTSNVHLVSTADTALLTNHRVCVETTRMGISEVVHESLVVVRNDIAPDV
jgi:hypothetical protein